MAQKQKAALIILDGWGMAAHQEVSAVDQAHTPFVDSLCRDYPHGQLEASGLAVGLPEGQMGNSEVGHMNLGAGRVVYQDLVKLHKAVEEGTMAQEPVLREAFAYARRENKKVHFMGLLSDGGVHSHIYHLEGLIAAAQEAGCENLLVHAFMDGRDTDPHAGKAYLARLEAFLQDRPARIASLVGRYYAMDRDKRWERIRQAYDLLVSGRGEAHPTSEAAITASYQDGVTDEFVGPKLIWPEGLNKEALTLAEGDVVVYFNFRTDRARQLTQALSQEAFPEENMKPLPLHFVTLTRYDETFKDLQVVYGKDNLNHTLGEVLAQAGRSQVRIAETEKYPHVTFFFSGGREEAFAGEDRLLIPSPKVATYDLQPEMSAPEVRDAIVQRIREKAPDFICLNFANPDMVGHTGDMPAAIKACETVDQCTQAVVEAGLAADYQFIILADHGNADCMRNADGSPHTAHTTQPVPCFWVGKGLDPNRALRNGVLGDVAPSLLKIMQEEQPVEMTGKSLLP